MKLRRIAVIASLMLSTAHIAVSQAPNAARSKCPLTPAPQPPFTPTGALPQTKGAFFVGTPNLSVLLTHAWTVHQQSVRWFSDDRQSMPVNLKITGRRLDPDVTYMASQNLPDYGPKFFDGPTVTGRNLILSGLDFPSPGCWEITARLNATELRFVTYVTRPTGTSN